ncbi:MAG TPA: DUF3276 family protein [Rhodothermales bacterium]|mgnify:FL=1|nr:DUF3276 family protein [Rhodothermales bacterium]
MSYRNTDDSYDRRYDDRPRSRDREEVFSKRVPAGKRTYFFDVKSTRSGEDFFITITESKRVSEDRYEKHKIFLYKEDFGKFFRAFHEVVEHIRERMPDADMRGLPESVTFSDTDQSSSDPFRFDDDVFSDKFLPEDDQ